MAGLPNREGPKKSAKCGKVVQHKRLKKTTLLLRSNFLLKQ